MRWANTNSNNVCNTSIYSGVQGIALPPQSVALFFQIGMTQQKTEQ
ncbi:hypothetical protein FDUTEX481_08308 [Tolypothrix sp. PCC 7601]|nr:hypothetical protein FDUTEX481_08308 [Tolypothrix sp. PCC 7601]BAY90453.1 hypothetical protein NIES3275_24690 [Microchaete diplosiphon NIES-3275]